MVARVFRRGVGFSAGVHSLPTPVDVTATSPPAPPPLVLGTRRSKVETHRSGPREETSGPGTQRMQQRSRDRVGRRHGATIGNPDGRPKWETTIEDCNGRPNFTLLSLATGPDSHDQCHHISACITGFAERIALIAIRVVFS